MLPLRIGLISDTHGLLRSQAKDLLKGCDHILHAGDLNSMDILNELNQIAPTTAVRGNNDLGTWAQKLKLIERITFDTWSIVMTHNIHDLPQLEPKTNLVIFGHSHRFSEETSNGILFINPGSAGPRRFTLPITMAILSLTEKATVDKIILKNEA